MDNHNSVDSPNYEPLMKYDYSNQDIFQKDVNIFDKVQSLVDYYIKNPDQLTTIIDPKYKKFRLRSNFKEIHDITSTEQAEFQKRLHERLAERGIVDDSD